MPSKFKPTRNSLNYIKISSSNSLTFSVNCCDFISETRKSKFENFSNPEPRRKQSKKLNIESKASHLPRKSSHPALGGEDGFILLRLIYYFKHRIRDTEIHLCKRLNHTRMKTNLAIRRHLSPSPSRAFHS